MKQAEEISIEEIHCIFMEIRNKYKRSKPSCTGNFTIDDNSNRIFDSMDDFLAANPGIISIEEYLKSIK